MANNLEQLGFDSDLLRVDSFSAEIPTGILDSDSSDLDSETVVGGSLESQNFLSGSKGYFFDEDSFEINSGGTISGDIIIGGSISGSSLHIPDKDTTANSFHTDTSGNSWWGATETDFNTDNDNATAYILNTGVSKLQSTTISGLITEGMTASGTLGKLDVVEVNDSGKLIQTEILPVIEYLAEDTSAGDLATGQIVKLNNQYFGILNGTNLFVSQFYDGKTKWVSNLSTGLSGSTRIINLSDNFNFLYFETPSTRTHKLRTLTFDPTDETIATANEDTITTQNASNGRWYGLDFVKISNDGTDYTDTAFTAKGTLLATSIYSISAVNEITFTTTGDTTNDVASSTLWQSFTTTDGFCLAQVELALNGSAVSKTVTVEIYEGEGDTGTLLGSASRTFTPNVSTQFESFDFDETNTNPIYFNPSTQYSINVSSTGSNMNWSRLTTGGLSGGQAEVGGDFLFKINSTTNGAKIFAPAVTYTASTGTLATADYTTTEEVMFNTTGRAKVARLGDNKILVASENEADTKLKFVVCEYDNFADRTPTEATVHQTTAADFAVHEHLFDVIGIDESTAIGYWWKNATTIGIFKVDITGTTINDVTEETASGSLTAEDVGIIDIGTKEFVLTNGFVMTMDSAGNISGENLSWNIDNWGSSRNVVNIRNYLLAATEVSTVTGVNTFTFYSKPFGITTISGVADDVIPTGIAGVLTDNDLSLQVGKEYFPFINGSYCTIGRNKIGKSLSSTSLLIDT